MTDDSIEFLRVKLALCESFDELKKTFENMQKYFKFFTASEIDYIIRTKDICKRKFIKP